MIVATGLFAAAVGPTVWALGSMAGGIGQIINLYKIYQASTIAATIATKGLTAAILANPVGLAVAGIGTLAAILLTLKMNTDEATDAAKRHAYAPPLYQRNDCLECEQLQAQLTRCALMPKRSAKRSRNLRTRDGAWIGRLSRAGPTLRLWETVSSPLKTSPPP